MNETKIYKKKKTREEIKLNHTKSNQIISINQSINQSIKKWEGLRRAYIQTYTYRDTFIVVFIFIIINGNSLTINRSINQLIDQSTSQLINHMT